MFGALLLRALVLVMSVIVVTTLFPLAVMIRGELFEQRSRWFVIGIARDKALQLVSRVGELAVRQLLPNALPLRFVLFIRHRR